MPSAFPSFTIVASRGSRSDLSNLPTSLVSRPLLKPSVSCDRSCSLRSRRRFAAKVFRAANVTPPMLASQGQNLQGQNLLKLLACRAILEPRPARGFVVKRSIRCRCVVVLAAAVLTGALASGSAMASELSWSAPQRIDATESPREYPSPVLSCASASFCVAVDENSNALTFNGTSWTAPASIKGSYPVELRFRSVSCPTTTFCIAVGEGEAVTYSAGSWSQPTSIDATGGLLGVSCPSATFCAAVDSGGNALIYNGSSWTAPSHIDTTAEGIGSVSCASSSFCIAADYEGKTTIYNGSSWTTPADTTEPEGIGGLSCASSSFCAAIDWSGNALTYNGSAWSTPTNIGSAAAASCLSSSFCMAVGINGNAHIYNGSAWTTETGVSSPSEGDGLACASSSFCIATDMRGYAITFAEHESAGGGGGSIPPPTGGGSTSPVGGSPAPPIATPHHRLRCKPGYRKVRKHGKARCVKRKRHRRARA